MDPTLGDVSSKGQDPELAAKQRFESFKMGGGARPQSLNNLSKHSHGRSRSRNNSISSLSTLSLSVSAPSMPSSVDANTNVLSNPSTSKRPGSHHRRRSSVSTRRESAELMGVSLPDLPTAHSDDNINLGDKDSIRRRALWALEGKPDLAFSKVEIPDIMSPDVPRTSDFPSKPSFPPASAVTGHGISSLVGKRDSLGKTFGSTSASKDQLGTLVEEEEEEEEESLPLDEAIEGNEPGEPLPAKTPARPRPASLNLRPLALVRGSVVAPGSLPTPTQTPSPRPKVLKSLALAPKFDASSANADVTHSNATKRRTFMSSSTDSVGSRRSSYSFNANSPFGEAGTRKRSSISYKHSIDSTRDVALPSPEMTPTERRFSSSSDQSTLVEQPLTPAEQHFLFRSHKVLLARINELERTLRSRSSSFSRRDSYAASEVSTASSEPSDEMLQLISDLKAERDELKRDVDGWRMRVADANKQTGILAKRIDVERREAWVARSRLGLLELENSKLEKAMDEKTEVLQQSLAHNAELTRELDELKDEMTRLNARIQDNDGAVDECMRLRAVLEQECIRRQELEKLLDAAGLLNTPTIPHSVTDHEKKYPTRPIGIRPRGLGFQSVDSESSTTDVESADDSFGKVKATLDAVTEEDDHEDSGDEDGLAGYEDEEDSDLSFSSPGGSSVGSGDELDVKINILPPADEVNRSSSTANSAKLAHFRHASLSKTWTFPRGQAVAPVEQRDEIDRFFGCLDDADTTPPLGSDEMNKGMFSSAFDCVDEHDMPPFVIPCDVGVVVESSSSRSLDVVLEEDEEDGDADDEDELVGEQVEGGIRFTFNPPPTICITPPEICVTPPLDISIPPSDAQSTTRAVSRKPAPSDDASEDDVDSSSQCGPTKDQIIEPISPPMTASPPMSDGSPRPCSRSATPSSIPRATSLRSFSPKTPPTSFTPSKAGGGRFTAPTNYSSNSFVTPPSKQGGSVLSFIPQPVNSPSPSKYSAPTKERTTVAPLRSRQSEPGAINGSTFKPQLPLSQTSDAMSTTLAENGAAASEVTALEPGRSSICEYPCGEAPSTSLSFFMSSPLSARLSFRKLSNYIPLSWTPGAAAVSSCIVPSSMSVDLAESDPLLSDHGVDTGRPTERKFVSKDKQLEKLRSRLSLEREYGDGLCSVVSPCKGCRVGEVFL
ncbi:hypothetical protein F5I97DRAFT_1936078 [Phlebopus sp. FC_14]|nr:hypothetical protein F5I97DRAFT_1936078 [Phlebopus sp. FC_14]